jgi:hypothetical protein
VPPDLIRGPAMTGAISKMREIASPMGHGARALFFYKEGSERA